MLRLKAILFLCLFLFSTIGSHASVHFCDGEITEISFVTKAECEHKKKDAEESHCSQKKCCKSYKEEKQTEDCCETGDLLDLQDFSSEVQIQLFALATAVLPSFDFFQLIPESKEISVESVYLPPPDDGDILVDIQCFRI